MLFIIDVFCKNPEASRPEIDFKIFRLETSINLNAIIYSLFYNVDVTTIIRLLFIIKTSYKDFEASRLETFINLDKITYNLFYNVDITTVTRSLFENL
jgi:hypothetical protein